MAGKYRILKTRMCVLAFGVSVISFHALPAWADPTDTQTQSETGTETETGTAADTDNDSETEPAAEQDTVTETESETEDDSETETGETRGEKLARLQKEQDELLMQISVLDTSKEALLSDLHPEDGSKVLGLASYKAGTSAIAEQQALLDEVTTALETAEQDRKDAYQEMLDNKKSIALMFAYRDALQAELVLKQQQLQLQAGMTVLQKEQEAAEDILDGTSEIKLEDIAAAVKAEYELKRQEAEVAALNAAAESNTVADAEAAENTSADATAENAADETSETTTEESGETATEETVVPANEGAEAVQTEAVTTETAGDEVEMSETTTAPETEEEPEKKTLTDTQLAARAEVYIGLAEQQNELIVQATAKQEELDALVEELEAEEEEARALEEYKERVAIINASVAAPSGGGYSSTATVTGSGGTIGQQVVNYALQFVGNPYVWGGNSLTDGIDCSGFVQQVFAHFGVTLSRTTYTQCNEGTAVDYADMQPGDVIYYGGHTAIYIGNNQIVHAASADKGIIVQDNPAYRPIITIRRFI